MKTQEAQRCLVCQGLELVFKAGVCGNCGATNVDVVELPPKPTLRRHQDAYRSRAGMVGELLSCICTYPLDVNENTVSGCDPRCPREEMTKKRIEREETREAREQAKLEDDDLPPWERKRA